MTINREILLKLFQLIIVVTLLFSVEHVFGVEDAEVSCVENERAALLNLKQQLLDDYNRLSSWGTEEYQQDCCRWKGVECDDQTGHVIILDLHGPSDSFKPLRGYISPLFELKQLEYLDLSYNDFSGTILSNISSLTRLHFLNLSRAGFGDDAIQDHLGNLSKLRTLDLSYNSFFHAQNLEWLSRIRLLEHLNLENVKLSQATNWGEEVSKLPHLKVLNLAESQLPDFISFPLVGTNISLMPLAILDLSGNNLNSSINSFLFNFRRTLNEINLSDNNLQGPIPDGFGSMIAIKHLDLSENKLEGGIPESLGNCSTLISLQLSGNRLTGQLIELVRNLSWTNQSLLEYLILDGNQLDGSLPNAISKFSFLKELKLSFNKLSGSIPNVYGKLPNLAILDLTGNQIEGSIPDFTLSSSIREISLSGNRLTGIVTESIGSLSNLEKLYLGSNDLGGEISEAHFTNLSRLQVLDLSFNSRLAMKFHSSNWTPPFQLNVIKLANCFLGPYFPNLLRNQENVSVLDVSVAGISGSIPKWFWHQFSGLRLMNLSHNHINGVLPDLSIQVAGLFLLDLSYNKFQGPVPHFPTKVTIGDLSHNMLSGPISFLCDDSFPNLGYLDLSDNMLSGVLPDCLDKSMIIYLNLANNNFSGKIPNSIGSLDMIKTLQLRNNSFTELPQSFRNCINLDFLDLGQNKFFGNIPAWLGESLSALVVLSLRGNRFNGSIPSNLCKLSNIQIIDFSENELVGAIPNCINNLTAMTREGSPTRAITHWYWYNFVDAQVQTNISYKSEAFLIWKGRQSKYKETLRLVKSIDLSSNKLTGEIPMEITSLIGLIGLNLSRNNFTGVINPRIGELRVLNFLDLSRNQLSGEIPTTLSQLSHLGVLDLSYNNLSGKIPMSTQLQTFNASTYEGNFLLCGSPLTKVCWGEESSRGRNFSDSKGDGRQKDIFDSLGFYVSIYLGIFFGFWGVFAILLLQRSWRYALFQMSDNLANRLYASTLVTMAKLRKWPGN